MDVDMPVKNGYIACENIRTMAIDDEYYNNMIICMCTAFEGEM